MILLPLLLLFAAAPAEPDWGRYELDGTVHASDDLVVLDTLQAVLGLDTTMIVTNELGQYGFTVEWRTWDLMMRYDALGNPVDVDQRNEEMNPPVVFFFNPNRAIARFALRADADSARVSQQFPSSLFGCAIWSGFNPDKVL